MSLVLAATLGLAIALTSDAGVAAGAPSVDEVTATYDDLFRSRSAVGRLEVTVTGPRHTRTLTLATWTRGTDRALIVIEAPAREAGTATLRVKDNLWNYLPKVARTIRVPPAMMLGSWMGTDLTNDDLVKESSARDDYVARPDGRSEDPPGWRYVLEAKPGLVGRWSRLVMVVDDAKLPKELRSYDRQGALARVMRFDDVRTLGGRTIPTRVTLTPTDAEGQRTVLRYLEMQFDAEVPDDTFSLSRLERSR